VVACIFLSLAGPVPNAAAQPIAITGDEWLTQWWSWVFWWEANREDFLQSPIASEDYKPASQSTIDALLDALSEERAGPVQAAAALALGRMEERSAVPRLV
jgi:hypothetical protein